MTEIDKQRIATSFPVEFEEASVGIQITHEEYQILFEGIYAEDMDSKWHIFGLDNIIFFARSWTSFCIYKAFTKNTDDGYILEKIQVNKNSAQYRSQSIVDDVIWFKKLLRVYLKRSDLYIDPELSISFIKTTIEQIDPRNEYQKTVGTNSVGLTRKLHSAQNIPSLKIIGWNNLEENIAKRHEEEELLSVHLFRQNPSDSFTLYFDKNGHTLLGQITTKWT